MIFYIYTALVGLSMMSTYIAPYNQDNNLIQAVSVDNSTIRIKAHKEFHDQYLVKDFFAHYSPAIDLTKLDYTLVTIPFLMNVIPIVWFSNRTYTIDAMDEDLYYAFATIQEVFKAFYPSTPWSGKLLPKKLVKNRILHPATNTIATLFSHGLDAVYTALHNRDKKQILVTVCGGDIPLHKKIMWENVTISCKAFAQEHGHSNVFVRSNFNTFRNFKYLRSLTPDVHGNWFAYTSQGLGYTGLAAPIAYVHGCAQVLLASTRTSDNPFPYGTHPLIDNAISFAGIAVEHGNPEVNRIEKIREIALLCTQHNLKKPLLRVCWGKDPLGGNCTTCEKCFRTIVELLVEKQIPEEYGFAIPLEEAIDRAKKYSPGKKLETGLYWHWQCIQYAAQQAAMYEQESPFKDFIMWVAELDLPAYKSPRFKQRPVQEKKVWSTLWKKAANRTFTVADLGIIKDQLQV